MLSKKGALVPAPIPAKDWNKQRNQLHEIPLPVEEIVKDIDFVFLSHLHFDHWDKAAANVLPQDIKVIVQDAKDKKRLKISKSTTMCVIHGLLNAKLKITKFNSILYHNLKNFIYEN